MERVRILFVDDEPHVLSALRRSMIEMQDQWETAYCDSANAALAALEQQPADVVVADMRMPDVDGAQLLDEIRERYPATIRIILSGYAEAESVMKTVGSTHIYLAKPCDTKNLRAAIARPLALRRLLSDPGLRAAVGEVSTLPSLPEIFIRIGDELRSPRASAASVAALLSKDVAMTAEVLKVTNSAFFGLGARVTTALQAVRTLGMETIHTLVLSIGLFRQFSGNPAVATLLADLNRSSLSLGKLAELIARDMGGDDAVVNGSYCAGMLSGIGSLIFLDRRPNDFLAALAGTKSGASLAATERATFGATHYAAGAYLLGLWAFSEALVEAVAFAAEPSAAPGRDNVILTSLHVATALGPRFPLLPEGGAPSVTLDMAYLAEAKQDENLPRWQAWAEQQLGGD